MSPSTMLGCRQGHEKQWSTGNQNGSKTKKSPSLKKLILSVCCTFHTYCTNESALPADSNKYKNAGIGENHLKFIYTGSLFDKGYFAVVKSVFTVMLVNRVVYVDTIDYICSYDVHFSTKFEMLVVSPSLYSNYLL